MNYLNSIFKFLSVAFLATTMSACTIDDATDVPLVALGSIEKNFVVEADANTFDIDIYANGAYHVDRINESDWLKLELGSIEDGKSKITADVEFNEGFKRMAGLVLCSDVDARRDTIYVRQKALVDARIEFDNSSVIVKGAGGTESTPIITNVPFEDMTVEIKYANESNADWVESLVIEDADTEERSLVIAPSGSARTSENSARTGYIACFTLSVQDTELPRASVKLIATVAVRSLSDSFIVRSIAKPSAVIRGVSNHSAPSSTG